LTRNIFVLLAAVASMIDAASSPVSAQTCKFDQAQGTSSEPLLSARVDQVRLRASSLHLGTSAAEAEPIMGQPTRVDAFGMDGSDVRVLKYAAEPIATTVTFTDGKVSGVALDLARGEQDDLPAFTRVVLLGMARTALVQMLGKPNEDLFHDACGAVIEQMLFARAGEPEVSVFLFDQRVVARRLGRSIPPDILRVALPLAPEVTDEHAFDEVTGQVHASLGVRENEVRALYGAPKLHVDYTFKGRRAAYAIYATIPGKSFARFTFVDGVLIEFADGGKTPLEKILDGR
jgi:hypothetical protein